MQGQWKGSLFKCGPSWRGKWLEYFRNEDGTRTCRQMSKTIARAQGPGAVTKQEAQRILWDTVLSKLPGALNLSNDCPVKRIIPKKLASKIGELTAEGCLPWLAAKGSAGYGNIQFNGRTQRAHRVVYEIVVGPIPEGLCVLHRCDNPVCVNPEHLFTGSHQDNMDDSMRKGRHSSQTHGPRKRDEKGRFLPGRASQAGGLLTRAA